jgi:hypothetical protein
MITAEFKNWLHDKHNLSPRTIDSRVANCRTIEKWEGDLDEHYARDGGKNLLNRLTYSQADQDRHISARHSIPINGDIRNGSATLKSAARLYFGFRIG